MKILHIVDTLNPGGAERVSVDIANLMVKRLHQLGFMFLLHEGLLGKELDKRIIKHEIRRGWKFNPYYMLKVAAVISQYDVIHIHMRHVLKYILILRLLKLTSKRLIFQDHNGLNYDHVKLFTLMRNTFIYVGVSNKLREYAISTLGILPEHAYTISNIIVPRVPEPLKNDHQDGNNRIIVISNLYRLKNLELALEIVSGLLKKDPRFTLDVYGFPFEKDYYEELLILINVLRLSGKVKFIINETDIQTVIPQYKIALHTSKLESGPLVLMEYLSSGLPFLAFSTGEVAEQLRPHLPSFFMDNFDANAWVIELQKIILLENDTLREKRKILFKTLYNTDNYITQWENVYQKI